MNISNSKTSFQGVYRIPYTEKNAEEYQRYVAPAYNQIRHRPQVDVIELYETGIDTLFETAGESQGYSGQWAKRNAEINGIKIDNSKDYMYIITGDNDIKQFKKFAEQDENFNITQKENIFTKIKSLFTKNESNEYCYDDEKSPYLNSVARYLHKMHKDHEKLDNFMRAHNMIDINTTQQLLAQMLQEK